MTANVPPCCLKSSSDAAVHPFPELKLGFSFLRRGGWHSPHPGGVFLFSVPFLCQWRSLPVPIIFQQQQRRTAAPTHHLCDSTTAWKQPADQLFIPHCNRTHGDDRRRCCRDVCCSTNSSRKIQPFQSVFSYAMQRIRLCTLWNVKIWGVCRNMVIQTTSTRNSHHFWPVDHLFDNPFPWKEVKFQWPLTIKT